MELNIRGLGLEPTPAFKRYIERRLRHTLRSFDIDRVTVRLIRDHGRGRRATHCCDVAVSPLGLELLHVSEIHVSIRVAFARATSRMKRALVGALQRAGRLSRTARGAGLSYDLDVAAKLSTLSAEPTHAELFEPEVSRSTKPTDAAPRPRKDHAPWSARKLKGVVP